jgi:hypothetical protein
MHKLRFRSFALIVSLALASSCHQEHIDHVGAAKLVILQPVPQVENRFDEDFRGALGLLYPFQCHDTVFIQERVFLERIDLEAPVRREFSVTPNLLRDFFGSNNPDKTRALREALFFDGDSAFESQPGTLFLTGSSLDPEDYPGLIGAYVARNRKHTLVYLAGSDTARAWFPVGRDTMKVYHDQAKLSCTIVSALREKSREELAGTTVIVILIPPVPADGGDAFGDTRPVSPRKPSGKSYNRGCPPDSVVTATNRQRQEVITAFRNLLHYIATTTDDAELKRKFREDAWEALHTIPEVAVEGIAGNDLRRFLYSGFGSNLQVTPMLDRCRLICGVHIEVRQE